jgi:REP element-mobilizing transposase RayT
MLKKFLNKYRIPSARFINWDYGSNAPYFVTICTENKNCYFGEIHKGDIVLSPIGEIVRDEWLKTPVIRSDMNLFLDEFVVMPNHFHGILLIGENKYNNLAINNDNNIGNDRRDAMPGVSNIKTAWYPRDARHGVSTRFGPQIKNLGSIIRGFKSAVTINARKINPDFKWQERFYDHIISSERSYKRIRNYIIENPKKWDEDKFIK